LEDLVKQADNGNTHQVAHHDPYGESAFGAANNKDAMIKQKERKLDPEECLAPKDCKKIAGLAGFELQLLSQEAE